MTDPSQEILQAVETALEGNLKYPATTGDLWHVYSDDPKGNIGRYVVLVDLNMFDDEGDDTLDCDLTLEVVDGARYVGNAKLAPVNAIGSQIVALMAKVDISMTTYKMTVLPFIEEADVFRDINPDNTISPRKVLRFRFSVKEK